MIPESDLRVALSLIDLDHTRQARYLEGLLSTSNLIRGWAVTIWAALLGFAFSSGVWALAVLAAISVLFLGIADLYHSLISQMAGAHLRRLERASSDYLDYLIADSRSVESGNRLVRRVSRIRLGFTPERFRITRRRLRSLRRPLPVLLAMYPVLALFGIGAAFLV